MFATVKGVWRDGRIVLEETPEGLAAGTHVIVTFLDDAAVPAREDAEAAEPRTKTHAAQTAFIEEWETPRGDADDRPGPAPGRTAGFLAGF